jgi:hypothetical protein
LFYEDNYAGSNQAPGRELVRWQNSEGQRIWQMNYSGGMEPEYWGNEELAEQTFAFLKKQLAKVTAEKPFRGPRFFQERDSEGNLWSYINIVHGSLQQFRGDEMIMNDTNPLMIFRQNYNGCLIIPK